MTENFLTVIFCQIVILFSHLIFILRVYQKNNFSFSLIYYFTQWFIQVFIQKYFLFYRLYSITIILYFCSSYYPWFSCWELFQIDSCVLQTRPQDVFAHLLLTQRFSRSYIFPAPVFESVISPGIPGSFYWMIFWNPDLDISVLYATKMSLNFINFSCSAKYTTQKIKTHAVN